ncbi:MAG: 50S ribosomal protein L1 [Candidatus Caenarcaniphilales bacterium]|jgi:large subunit ribosomal protein L1|nr:50S ribosomal protein L1 [Candidatus Caenarcaniphilales bacterium]
MAKLTKRQTKIKTIVEANPGKNDAKKAIETLKAFADENCNKKNPQTFSLAIQLGIDTKANDQQVRASVSLPAGTGKTVRVAVVAKGEKVAEAKAAGAFEAGTEDIVKRIEDGWMDFDVLVAAPDCMPLLGKLGRVLGPRGLMPNPKDGTVVADVAKAVKDLQAGKVSFRAEKTGAVVHMPIGNSKFSAEDLIKNLAAAIQEINKCKPSSSKGVYLKSAFVSITQGPGLQINPDSLLVAV